MGKYTLTPSEQARFDRMWRELGASKKATAVLDFEHFCSWLRGEDTSFYYAIKNKLQDLWDEVKSTIGEIAEGVAIGAAAVVALPAIAAVEGIKAIGRWLDDL